MPSFKVSADWHDRIKIARQQRGWNQDDPRWLIAASKISAPGVDWETADCYAVNVSLGTWKRFLGGKIPIKTDAFQAYCQVLGFNWEEVAESSPARRKPRKAKIHSKQDWGEAIDGEMFIDRVDELATLKKWIVENRSRLVSIVGMGGVGKSSLAYQLALRMRNEFDYIIWRSLREAPPIDKILADCIKHFSHQQSIDLPQPLGEKITLLLNYLRSARCLMILDNGESIFESGELAGTYREGYADYGELFRRWGSSQHQSCLLLTSREQFPEVRYQAGEVTFVRVLELTGLEDGARSILTAKGLNCNDRDARELIQRYHGNPMALKIVADTIQKTFNGNIQQFLQSAAVFGTIKDLLAEQFDRLSHLERSVMYWLAIHREAVTIKELAYIYIYVLVKLSIVSAIAL
jgi:hypothetical protein